MCMLMFLRIFSQEEKKNVYDPKAEIVFDGKRYAVWNNYLTVGGLPGGSINSAIPTSQFCGALDYNFHIKNQYFQSGILMSGNVFGDENNTQVHACWGKRIEKNRYNFAAYGGVDFSLFYRWAADSVPPRFISPALNAIGAYAAVQNFWKFKYDVGIGCTLFGSYNTYQYLFGARIELFFSSAYHGEKGRRRIL
jgi:hypothetical protein